MTTKELDRYVNRVLKRVVVEQLMEDIGYNWRFTGFLKGVMRPQLVGAIEARGLQDDQWYREPFELGWQEVKNLETGLSHFIDELVEETIYAVAARIPHHVEGELCNYPGCAECYA